MKCFQCGAEVIDPTLIFYGADFARQGSTLALCSRDCAERLRERIRGRWVVP